MIGPILPSNLHNLSLPTPISSDFIQIPQEHQQQPLISSHIINNNTDNNQHQNKK
jgi:hypothetical protein